MLRLIGAVYIILPITLCDAGHGQGSLSVGNFTVLLEVHAPTQISIIQSSQCHILNIQTVLTLVNCSSPYFGWVSGHCMILVATGICT